MKNWQAFGLGVIAVVMVVITIGGAIAVSLNQESVILASRTLVHPSDPSVWMTCTSFDNPDNTIGFLCEMPDAVAVTLNKRFGRDWSPTIYNEFEQIVPNPQSKIYHSLGKPLKYFADEYHAQVITEWEADKPGGLE